MCHSASRCAGVFLATSVISAVFLLSSDLSRLRQALFPTRFATADDLSWLREGVEVEFADQVWTVVHVPEDFSVEWTVSLRSSDETAYAAPHDLRPVGSWQNRGRVSLRRCGAD
jgi:hypothetical protein